MHSRFRKNLAKLMVCAISIPSVYAQASVSTQSSVFYDKDGVMYISDNVVSSTTTSSAIEIAQETPLDQNKTTGSAIETPVVGGTLVDTESVGLVLAISEAVRSDWDGVSMQEPQLEGRTYLVTCADEMAWLENGINSGNLDTTGITIQLMNDIDFKGKGVVIGTKAYPFRGTFNGGGYTLSKLNYDERMKSASKYLYVGLFGYSDGASFLNLKLDIVAESASGLSPTVFGYLVGVADNIKNLHDIELTVVGKDDNMYCSTRGMLIGKATHDNSNLEIRDIKISGQLNGNYTYSSYYGGVIGELSATQDSLNIEVTNLDLAYALEGGFSVNEFGGVFGEISGNKTGTFLADNCNINFLSLQTRNTIPYIGGFTAALRNFGDVTLKNINAELATNDGKALNVGSATGGLVIGEIYNSNKDTTNRITLENCNTSAKDNLLASLIGKISLPSSCESTVIINDVRTNCDNGQDNHSSWTRPFGSVVGSLDCDNLIMSNCISTGRILGVTNHGGGFIGELRSTWFDISNCENNIDLSGQGYIGGLVGNASLNQQEKSGIIRNCKNTGSVESSVFTGGIFGYLAGITEVDGCTNLATITQNGGFNSGVGGVFGYLSAGSTLDLATVIKNCYINASFETNNANMGGLIGLFYNGALDIANNVVEGASGNTVESTSDGKLFFGGLCGVVANFNKLTVSNNTIKGIDINSLSTSDVLGGLIGVIDGNDYNKDSKQINITGNSINNVEIDTSTTNSLGSGLIGTNYIIGSLIIDENTLDGVTIKTGNSKNASLVSVIEDKYAKLSSVVIKNNLIKTRIDSSTQNADLVGVLEVPTSLNNNIILVEGQDVVNGALSKKDGVALTTDSTNYYLTSTSNNVASELFTPLNYNDFGDMSKLKSLDFGNIWGFSEDNLKHPVLGVTVYQITANESICTLLKDTQVIKLGVSHPCLENSIVMTIEDEDIATIENGVIIPKSVGVTRIVYKTEGLPLSEQLECSQLIRVGDYTPKLDVTNITINQGADMPKVLDFVTSYTLEHPFDSILTKDVKEDALYQVTNVRNEKGSHIEDFTTSTAGVYTLTLQADFEGYVTEKDVKLEIKDLIDSLVYAKEVLRVEKGTVSLNELLPNFVEVNLVDGQTLKLGVPEWRLEGYNALIVGDYVVSAVIKLPAGMTYQGLDTVVITKPISVYLEDTPVDTPSEEIPDDKPVETPSEEIPEDKPVQTPTEDTYYDDDDYVITVKPVEAEKEEPTKVKDTIIISFKVGDTKWAKGGNLQSIIMDKAPELVGNRAYVPIRFLAYALGLNELNIKWNNKSKEVEIKDGENTMNLKLNSTQATLNGEEFTMDGVPYLSAGRVMLPISQIKGVFNHRNPVVEWNQTEQEVSITLKQEGFILDKALGTTQNR